MTGSVTLQPFQNKGKVALFNGEIYNYKDIAQQLTGNAESFSSDGEVLLPAYSRWGNKFISKLRGEFAIVLVDFEDKTILLSTDAFSTKPLWIAVWDGKIVVASYQSALLKLGASAHNCRMAEPNEVLVLDISTNFLVKARLQVYSWNLDQFKNSTLDWRSAFERAVEIRMRGIKHTAFIGLSSGYDSGAIMLALLRLKMEFLAYSVRGREVPEVVLERALKCQKFDSRCEAQLLQLDMQGLKKESSWLQNRIEPYTYIHRDSGLDSSYGLVSQVHESTAAIGLSAILSLVRKRGGLIYISGGGADEIISDYAIDGIPHGTSCFRGKFPNSLNDIFPWCNFYKGSQRAFLMKEELVGGAHGIETRYPFLDVDVVQEYLWLRHDLKNAEYKKPIADYLREGLFPNAWKVKRGFSSKANVVANSSISTVNHINRKQWTLDPSLQKMKKKAARTEARESGN